MPSQSLPFFLLLAYFPPGLLTDASPFIRPLQAAVNLLANTSYGRSCWICLEAQGSSGEAWPTSLKEWAQTEGFMYYSTSTGHQGVHASVKKDSLSHPVIGPIYTKVALRAKAPLCLSSPEFPQGSPVGSLNSSFCNFTVTVHTKDRALLIKPPLLFSSPPNISVAHRLQYTGGFCQGRPLSCKHFALMADSNWGSIGIDNCSLIHEDGKLARTFIDTTRRVMFWEDLTSSTSHNNTPCFSPLTAASFAATYLFKRPTTENPPLSVHHLSGCLPPTGGMYFVCGTLAYQCLPSNWTGVCTLAYVLSTISVANASAPIPIPLHTTSRLSKRIPPLIPILVGISTVAGVAGVATGTTGAVSANNMYTSLSSELAGLNTQIAASLFTLQNQINSLAAVVLQNRRALDMLTAAQGVFRVIVITQAKEATMDAQKSKYDVG
ncbi:syncytin-2-like [Lepus europaeus]|uniref:syncytin-2-like n=1 Tax=Lepus europaeus TaxID=9983 RepID=UPI002B4A9782|nr:syncytin-2-like [Lepus europaeus]